MTFHNSTKLGASNAIITDSLAIEYKKLDFLCRKLKEKKVIHESWFFNGKLCIKTLPDAEIENITHIDDLYKVHSVDGINGLLK